MKLEVYFKFESLSCEHIIQIYHLLSEGKGKLKKIEVTVFPNYILSKNPVTGKKYIKKDFTKVFNSIEELMELCQQQNFCDRYYFEFVDGQEWSIAAHSRLEIVAFKPLSFLHAFVDGVLVFPNFYGALIFNPLDLFERAYYNSSGSSRSFRTPTMNFFPAPFIWYGKELCNEAMQYLKIEEISITIRNGSFYLNYYNDLNSITIEKEPNLIEKLLGLNTKFILSKNFELQKELVEKLNLTETVSFFGKNFQEKKFASYGHQLLKSRNVDLLSYYWMDEKGNIVPEYRSFFCYVVISYKGNTISKKLIKTSEFTHEVDIDGKTYKL